MSSEGRAPSHPHHKRYVPHNGDRYIWRKKAGTSVFTGFLRRADGTLVWIGKDERTMPPRVIDTDNGHSTQFYLFQMRQYDDE